MYRNILLAYDGSRDGREALEQGAKLAVLCGARVSLLTVMSVSGGMLPVEGISFVEDEVRLTTAALEEGRRRLRAWGVVGSVNLRYGNPAEQIASSAREIGADLVVIGHHRQNALWRWLNGSVGAAILNRACCSVLVAMEPNQRN